MKFIVKRIAIDIIRHQSFCHIKIYSKQFVVFDCSVLIHCFYLFNSIHCTNVSIVYNLILNTLDLVLVYHMLH